MKVVLPRSYDRTMQSICNKIALESKLSHDFIVYMRATPSHSTAGVYLRTPPWLRQFPRKYCRTMQPICNKIVLESKLSHDFIVYMRATPSHSTAGVYLRTPPWLRQFPRKYCRTMQPICNKIALESKLSHDFIANVHFLLYLCRIIWYSRQSKI